MKKTILVVLVLALAPAFKSLAAEDTWARKSDMPTARCTFSTGVVNERIYAIGGAKGRTDALRSAPLQVVEEYHPTTDTWTRKADMPTARNALSVSVVEGRIYAFGGAEGIGAPLNTVEEYNPATDTWTNKADMPTARFALSTSAVNGKIYAIGGSMGGFRALSTVEQYDPVTDIWTKKADIPTARIHISTCVVDGKIYAIGGVTGTSAYASTAVEQYDPATDTWTRKANMPSAGCTLSTSVVNGKIYAIGGSAPMPALAPLSTVQEYDPVTNKWTNKTDMPTARSGLSTNTVNGKIYVIGGLANPTGMALATVEEYDTGFIVTPTLPDFNGDGIVDSVDICMMIDHWGENYPLCDIGPTPFGDGIVDVQDLIVLVEHLFEEALPFGLTAYWKLDETEGGIAEDTAGDNDGVLLGEPLWQPDGGMKAGALQLDGTDDYMSTAFVLNPAEGAFSAVAWLKGGEPGDVVISQVDGISGSGETWLGTEAVSGKLMTGLVAPPVGRFVPKPLVSESVVTNGQWHNIGFVWDGTYRSLYVDGVEVAKDTAAQNPLKSATGGLYIGAGRNLEAGTFFSGLIDEVRIYNVALSADKIETLAR